MASILTCSFTISTFLLYICGIIATTIDQDPNNPAILRFQEYLRFDTSHPNPQYNLTINWLHEQCDQLGLEWNLYSLPLDPPNATGFALWLTWAGTNPNLKSIMINSHMDVVAVDPISEWEHLPFDGDLDENGYIHGRGTVDMKSATVAALEAIRALKGEGFQPLRNIHLTIMPDEEVGGHLGMEPFVNSTYFDQFNIGLDIDECEINDGSRLLISTAEKSIWQFNITAIGTAAHASTLPPLNQTASGKLEYVINRLHQFRSEQWDEVNNNPDVNVADVTTVNLVQMGGGLGNNIIPDLLWASFDMRILPKVGWNYTDVDNFLHSIIAEAGPGVYLEFIQKSEHNGVTLIDDGNVGSIWWNIVNATCVELNVTCAPQTISGATDGRYVRSKGIPVLGIHPFLNTAKLAHQHNEKIHSAEFLAGIPRFTAIIKNVASLPETEEIDGK